MDPGIGIENGAVDRIPRPDLNRMALSIEQEVRAKLKEMRIQTVQIYNTLKSERIEHESKAVAREMQERRKKMAEYRAMSEGSMKNAMKKRMQVAKNNKLSQIMHAVEEELEGRSLAGVLIEECISQVGEENLGNFLIYALQSDHSSVREYLMSNYSTRFAQPASSSEEEGRASAVLDEAIRTLPKDGLGGVIFFSRDGNIVCDNSFRTRLEIFRERHLKLVHQALFR